MDLFTQIKMGVSVKEAAEYYGLETIFYKGIMPSETGFRFSSGL